MHLGLTIHAAMIELWYVQQHLKHPQLKLTPVLSLGGVSPIPGEVMNGPHWV